MMRRHKEATKQATPGHLCEKGSAFFYILLAVVLFGTLSFTVSRGMRGQQASTMSERKAELAASELLDSAQKIQRAIDYLRRNGCSENDISMETPDGLNINANAPVDESCHIFSPSGGKVVWNTPQASIAKNSFWRASSYSHINDIGTAKAELLLYLPSVNKVVCEKINKSANIVRDTIPLENGYAFDSEWNGSFNDGSPHVITCDGITPSGSCDRKAFACIESDVSNIDHGNYIFYYVLIER